MQSTQPPDESDSGLDRLLREARWPEPTSEQLTRLRDRWTRLRAKHQGQHYLVTLLSAAAAILLLAVGLIVLRTQNDAPAPAGPNNQIASREPTDDEGAELARSAPGDKKIAAGSSALGHDARPLVRKEPVANLDLPHRAQSEEPSLYERVAMIGLTQSSPRKSPPKRLVSSGRKPRRSLTAASAAPQGAREVTTKIPTSLDEATQQFAIIARAVERRRQQVFTAIQQHAVRLVARAAAAREPGSNREIPLSPQAALVEMVSNQGRPADIANLIAQEPDAALRRRLLTALAARGTADAVEEYLYFVMRPECSVEALDALADVVEPPDGLFLAYFRSPQVSLRLAAAMALSRSRNPIVVDVMAAAIDDPSLRRQALMALLLSRDPRAAAIVNEARGNLYLVASVRAAESELHQLAQTP